MDQEDNCLACNKVQSFVERERELHCSECGMTTEEARAFAAGRSAAVAAGSESLSTSRGSGVPALAWVGFLGAALTLAWIGFAEFMSHERGAETDAEHALLGNQDHARTILPDSPSSSGQRALPPMTEDEALELARSLSDSAIRREVESLDLATQQAVGRCAAAMGAARSKGKLGQVYSDPEKVGSATDPLRNVGGRYGHGPLPSREDRERVYRFAYELGKGDCPERVSMAAVLLFAARLFGRGEQPLPQWLDSRRGERR